MTQTTQHTPNNSIDIRPARLGDEEQLLGLTKQIAAAEGDVNSCTATAEQFRRVLLEEKRAHVLVAVEPDDDNRLLGMIIFYDSFASFAGERGYFLENLVVDSGARGRGVAPQLMQALKDAAIEAGVKKIEWACDRNNKPARKFYEQGLKQIMDVTPEESYMIYSTKFD